MTDKLDEYLAKQKERGDRTFLFLIIGAFVIAGVCIVGAAAAEAEAYNRLTGGHATWWDALWVELRVTGKEP